MHACALPSPERRDSAEYSSYIRLLNLNLLLSELTALPVFMVSSSSKPQVSADMTLLSMIIAVIKVRMQSKSTTAH